MTTRSILFPPMPSDAGRSRGKGKPAGRELDTRPAPAPASSPGPARDVKLWTEPTEEILILGLMMRDNNTIESMLKRLAFDPDYQGSLRVIAGAAVRIRERCEKLLGESKTEV